MKRLLALILMAAMFVGVQGVLAQGDEDMGDDEGLEAPKPEKEKVEKVKKEKKEVKPAAPKPELQDLTLTGQISAEEKKSGKDEAKTKTVYMLTDADGNKVELPQSKGKKGAAPAVSLSDYVGGNVTVFAKGMKTGKEGKTRIKIAEVVSITKN